MYTINLAIDTKSSRYAFQNVQGDYVIYKGKDS